MRQIPYFNAPIYLENITQVGKVDEIFGTRVIGFRASGTGKWEIIRLEIGELMITECMMYEGLKNGI